MNFNFDSGLIDTIQTIDCSSTPPLGGVAGVLNLEGTGALVLLQGNTDERPDGVGGMFRWNSETTLLEYYNGTTWETLSTSSGSVTSVDIGTTSAGLTVGGGPVTNSGTLTVNLSAGLQALHTLAASEGSGIVAQTGENTFTQRTITGTASNISVTNGSGVSGNPTIDLVDAGTPVSGSFVKITTDTKGRVTATTNVTASDITALVDDEYVNVEGDTISGNLTFTDGATVTGLPDPVNDSDAANKGYVDAVANGLSWKQSVRVATTEPVSLATGIEAGDEIDGVTLVAGDRILVKDQADLTENGIYVVQESGTAVRSDDMDATTPINEVNGAAAFVEEGDTLANTAWTQINAVSSIGDDPIEWSQFAGAGSYTAGTGLVLNGNEFSLDGPVSIENGGTGLDEAPAAGELLIGNGSGYTLATLTEGTAIGIDVASGSITINNEGVTSVSAGSGISIDASTGEVTISNTGVTSVAGTANQISASASTGSLTLSVPSTFVAPGSVEATTTLKVTGNTANSFLYSGAGGLVSTTAAPTNGQLLIGSTGNAPVAATLSSGNGISITNGAGSITIANTGVLSVGLEDTSANSIFAITNSPVQTSGTLTFQLATMAANLVFAGPTDGSEAEPGFRSLVAADLPDNAGLELYAENASSPVAPSATGTNAIALGSGSKQTNHGGLAHAGGYFTGSGDAQEGFYVLRGITTNNSATDLFLDGAGGSQRLVFPNNSVATFDILIAARRTDATGGGAGYRFVGVIKKDGTAGSNTIVGAVSKTVIGETNMAWDATVTADTTNGNLRITVTGENSKTIRWVATVRTSEVTN